ncbi:hypothetical protein, partial [Escherichia coli]|uniref:hypothetical protein n=1 Tax=Escherichia coli TaxID=562 RepID=UPI001BAF5241
KPAKLFIFNMLQGQRRPDKRSASGNFALVISFSAPSQHLTNSLNEYLLPFHSRLFLICCFKNK